jgi:hypothetical protein
MSHSSPALQATVDEFVRLVDIGFASLPESRTKYDRTLRRKARQAALIGVPSMQIFGGNDRAGWTALAYAARLHPAETLLQPRFVELVGRTLLRRRGYRLVRTIVRRVRGRRSAASF